ncbi:hypothetical protein GCM10017687_67930 [Streptomyces echinatus]|uniref:hypothetical protein n=1 Tax=Streptomyces echinatus TaxID=67293 RepID=UPI0031EB60BB
MGRAADGQGAEDLAAGAYGGDHGGVGAELIEQLELTGVQRVGSLAGAEDVGRGQQQGAGAPERA